MKTAALCCLALLLSVQAQAQNDPYITVWNTFFVDDNAISFNAEGDFTYTWEQISGGTATQPIPQVASGNTSITFPSDGEYRLVITPDTSNGNPFSRIYFEDTNLPVFTTAFKLKDIEQWGDVHWTSFEFAYAHTYQLSMTAPDVPNLSNVASMHAAFKESGISDAPEMNSWDMSNVMDMSAMFHGAENFNQPIGNWNVGNVLDMSSTFSRAASFDQPLGAWDVSHLTTMDSMFYQADAFNQPIGDWNVVQVTDMSQMFRGADNFNQPIGDWNVGQVTDMSGMFHSAMLFNQPIGNWDVSQVSDMSQMFKFAGSFDQDLSTWDLGQVTTMQGMFNEAVSFNGPIGTWNVSQVTDMSSMFDFATQFNQPIGGWDVSQVTDMKHMFQEAYEFNQFIGNWDVSQVTDMSYMFSQTTTFNQPIGSWNVSQVTNMRKMFYYASQIDLDLGDWDLSSILSYDWDGELLSMFDYSGMQCENYSATLQGWAANPNTPTHTDLGAYFMLYSLDVADARNHLINDLEWGITGDGQGNCLLPESMDELAAPELFVGPNPTVSTVRLQAERPITEVVLYDLLGQQVLAVQPATLQTRLDIADLPAGAYLMQVSIDGARRNYKLIKE